MLTVIGFSVHDTIVVFDRIRENRAATPASRSRGRQPLDPADVRPVDHHELDRRADAAARCCCSAAARSSEFVLALLIGIISGTYSSIFNASPLLVVWQRVGGQAPQRGRPSRRRPRAVGGAQPDRPRRARSTPLRRKSPVSGAWHPDDVTDAAAPLALPGPDRLDPAFLLDAGQGARPRDRAATVLAARGRDGRGRRSARSSATLRRASTTRARLPDAAVFRRADRPRARARRAGAWCSATSTPTGSPGSRS